MLEIIRDLEKITEKGNILTDEPMKDHTSFRTGGNADCFVSPASAPEVKEIIGLLKEKDVPYFVMGNGSNLLVSDKGYRGVIVHIGRNISDIRCDEDRITAGAGASLGAVASVALEAGLEGFEFASGIPGSIGGAVVMNAGAYGGEMKEILSRITVLDKDLSVREYTPAELELGYRTSNILKNERVVLEAEIILKKGKREDIKACMDELAARRREKQPLNYPSAGSTFKRPEGYFAGKLISDAGLKGYSVGGAQVSEKHAGFVINTGNATSDDINRLICHIQDKVKSDFGVTLEKEVKYLGEF